MKKVYLLEDLDCPNCAAKLEASVGRVDGVESASVNLLLQRLTVEIDEAHEAEIFKAIVKAAKKSNPDVTVRKQK